MAAHDTLRAASSLHGSPGAYTLPSPDRDREPSPEPDHTPPRDGEPAARGALDWRRWKLPNVVTVAVALVVWRIFFPALMSYDSIVQYGQALAGRYDNWHPPLMAIVLHYVFSLGGAIGILMLAQCLAGAFGVRALAAEVMRTLFGDRLAPARIERLSLAVLLLLLLPISPLAFYLMTFWKDAWAAVVMLWLGALTLRLGRAYAPRRLAAAVLLGAVLAMLRHNAALALPFLGVALAFALPPPRRWRGLAVAAAPLLLFLAGNATLERAFDVQKGRVDSAIMVLDLVGLCIEGPEVCRELPWTQSHVRDPKALAEYRPGDMGVVFWRPTPPVDLSMSSNYPRLRAEYLHAARRFPLLLAKQKVQGFVSLLGLGRTFYFFHSSIVDNPHRLALNERLKGPRDWLVTKTGNVALSPRWRWIAGVHAVWLAVDVLAMIALFALGWRRRRRDLVSLALVLLLPLGYYLSYLLAAPVEDFRFMYPSTLFVQGATLAALLAGATLLQKPIGRLPYLRRLSANADAGA